MPRTNGYRGVSRDAAQKHYDVSDEFFRIWLGPSLAYAAGLWEDGADTLEKAQLRKTDYLLGQAGIRPGHRVLDIGCGYGAEMQRMVEEYDVDSVTGITLSESAVEWTRNLAIPRTEIRLENWIDHRPAQPYDAIICVEAMEHFARPGMSGRAKTRGYREFFSRCRSWLRPEGRLVIQTITWGHRFPWDLDLLRGLYLASKVYPECNPSYLSELQAAGDGLFDLVALRNDFDHYARTLRCWLENLDADRRRAAELVGEKKARDFERCMTTAVRAFSEGWLHLHRLTFRPVPEPVGPARRFLVNNVLARDSLPTPKFLG
ncbi:cyclopropane-fatty-acyl-phospholipid synthase family protein [Streptomyces sp. KLMMK]|uniref:cyclopropane-fatty-acyl-phospholipid synthase family protein n=1 Tax=Streptomyces sp. KLMMK TaxID=3109353 RepID=UPI003009F646